MHTAQPTPKNCQRCTHETNKTQVNIEKNININDIRFRKFAYQMALADVATITATATKRRHASAICSGVCSVKSMQVSGMTTAAKHAA